MTEVDPEPRDQRADNKTMNPKGSVRILTSHAFGSASRVFRYASDPSGEPTASKGRTE